MRWIRVTCLVIVAVAFCVFFSSSGYAAEFTLRYSNFFPAPHKNAILADQWCKEIEKQTNGRVKINFFPGAVLTPAAQTYDSVVKGIADIGSSVLSYTMGKFPLMEAVDLPLGYKSGYWATRLANEFYHKFQPKELDETKVMYLYAHGPGILHTKKPVYKLEELKGMKIRSQGTNAKVVTALGAAPVGMPMNEAYDALSRGVADGIVVPYEALQGWRLGEVIRSSTEDYSCAYTATMFVVMNKAKWNSLPKDIQEIIAKVNEEYMEKQGRLWDEIDKEGHEFTKKRGNLIIKLPKEEESRWGLRMKPIWDEYVSQMKPKGLPAEEALKFCLDYLKANDKRPEWELQKQ
jgi:TRAP-type C4-dicarboxylate transport system substrate-binding protein